MRKLSAIGAMTGVLLFPTGWVGDVDFSPPTVAEPAPPPGRVVTGVIPSRATISTVLSTTLGRSDIHTLVEAARPVYDLARVSVGHSFNVVLSPQGLLHAFSYGIDELKTLNVRRAGDGLTAEIVERQYDVDTATVAGTIRSSLFDAVAESGEADQLALDLADIFAWDVDFNTELQKGDSFRARIEKLSLDGRFKRYGRILAAEFVRGDRTLRAVRFEGSRSTGYFAPDGTPLRRAFLRSPLRFTRISSGFTGSRLHPILGYRTPHHGIDYAAPAGTPVLAAGNGVVTLAGWSGGYGKTIKVRHPNGYETLYGHLSRIDARVGDHVSQGDRIGAVGSTGLATGPHLDYRMTKGGAFVNPLRVVSPAAEPLPAVDRDAFTATAIAQLAQLDGAPAPSIRTASR